jgi:hypothetical protein
LPEPDDIVASVMTGIEPNLPEEAVRQATADAAASRAKRRCLAHALTDNPDLLTSGRPEGPRVIGEFARALLAHGSRRAVLPKCADCSSTKKLTSLRADGKRVCQPCDHEARAGVGVAQHAGRAGAQDAERLGQFGGARGVRRPGRRDHGRARAREGVAGEDAARRQGLVIGVGEDREEARRRHRPSLRQVRQVRQVGCRAR